MERTASPQLVAPYLERAKIAEYFDTEELNFSLCRYEKGELLTTPLERTEELMFVIEGSVKIYGLRSDGVMTPVNQMSAPVLLGDIEFTRGDKPLFFSEAVTEVTCLTLSLDEYRERLSADVRFLHTLLDSYAEKLQLFSFLDAQTVTIEERVLVYLENYCPGGELVGIEEAVLRLRCSRRQLQRVLKSLCEEGKVMKTGKGRYKLL